MFVWKCMHAHTQNNDNFSAQRLAFYFARDCERTFMTGLPAVRARVYVCCMFTNGKSIQFVCAQFASNVEI